MSVYDGPTGRTEVYASYHQEYVLCTLAIINKITCCSYACDFN